MNKKIIISLMLSSVLFAPYAQAMNSLLPKTRPVTQMLMNPSVRSAVMQGHAIAHAAAPQAQRGLMTLAQSTVRPANQLLNGQNLTRQFSSTMSQEAATSIKSLAGKAGAIGLACAIALPNAVACSDGNYLSLFANLCAAAVGTITVASIILDPHALMLMRWQVEKNPEMAKEFTSYAFENFEWLSKDPEGVIFLEALMEHNPEIAKQFTPYTLVHIESLMKNGPGLCFLERLMKGNPDAAKELAPHALANVESLMQDVYGLYLLRDIMRDSEAIKQMTFAHIKLLMYKTIERERFFHYVIKRNPEAAKQFTSHAAPHIKSLVRSEAGMQFLHDIMNNNPQASEEFAPYALQNFESLVNNAEGRSILVSIANSNASAKTALFAEFKKHMGDKSSFSSSLTWEGMFYRLLNSESLTPTEFGLLYAEKEISEHKKQALEDPNIKKVVDAVIDIEKKYERTHYTFTHGRNRAYECVSTVYGALWQYAYNTPVPKDFIFTHTKDAHDPLMQQVLMNEERKLHEANIAERENQRSNELRNRRLFLNTQLFGNIGVRGSSSFSYFLHSSNASGTEVKVKTKDIFGQFGQNDLYEKYKEEFEALEKEHAALSEQGELLVVAVPKDRVNQDVTCMNVDGTAASQYMINGKMTNNVQEILEARKKDPSIGDNELNFTLAMTDTAALDPKNGIKIHSVQKIDEEKYAAWQAKVDALMLKIEAEFKASWKQSLEAKERGHGDLLDAVRASQKYIAATNNQK